MMYTAVFFGVDWYCSMSIGWLVVVCFWNPIKEAPPTRLGFKKLSHCIVASQRTYPQ